MEIKQKLLIKIHCCCCYSSTSVSLKCNSALLCRHSHLTVVREQHNTKHQNRGGTFKSIRLKLVE